jgi:hypothetical protein
LKALVEDDDGGGEGGSEAASSGVGEGEGGGRTRASKGTGFGDGGNGGGFQCNWGKMEEGSWESCDADVATWIEPCWTDAFTRVGEGMVAGAGEAFELCKVPGRARG